MGCGGRRARRQVVGRRAQLAPPPARYMLPLRNGTGGRVILRRRSVLAAGPAAAALSPRLARAQAPPAFPQRPVTLVVAFSAGSTNDILGRMLAAEVGPRLGQPVPVDNRQGAGGTLTVA